VVVGHRGLAGQRLDDGGGQALGHRQQLVPGPEGAGPGQDRHPLAGVEHRGGRRQLVPARLEPMAGRARLGGGGRGGRDVPVGVLGDGGDLDVVGERQVGDAAVGQGVAGGDVHHARDLLGVGDQQVVGGHVVEEPVDLHLLLVVGAQHRGLLHAGERQHRRVVELGVVEAVEEVDRAGPGRGAADAEPARGLGVATGHEGGGLLVMDQEEGHLLLDAPEPFHQAVDPVPWQPEHSVHAPVGQATGHGLTDGLLHWRPPRSRRLLPA
jgi:hypothetical protein